MRCAGRARIPPMNTPRIFCIGRNYVAHIEELGHPNDGDCVVFMKPPSCLVAPGTPLRLPQDRGAVHHEAELVVQLSGGGRNIAEDQALDYVSGITLGLDLTLRDEQNRLRADGKPWELAKAFDQAAPMGELRGLSPDDNLGGFRFECTVNGGVRQQGHTAKMLFPVARIIHILSQTWALAAGDLIYTGTPEGVGPLVAGDEITLAGDGLGPFTWQIAK